MYRERDRKIYDDFNKRNFNVATTATIYNILSKKIIREETRAFEIHISSLEEGFTPFTLKWFIIAHTSPYQRRTSRCNFF